MSTARDFLAAVQQRADAATDGPWEAMDLDHEVNGESYVGTEGHGWWWVWRTAARPHYGGVMESCADYTVKGEDGRVYHVAGAVGEAAINDGKSAQERVDAEFIAASRTDVPRLVAFALAVLNEMDDCFQSAALSRAPGEYTIDPRVIRDLADEHLTPKESDS